MFIRDLLNSEQLISNIFIFIHYFIKYYNVFPKFLLQSMRGGSWSDIYIYIGGFTDEKVGYTHRSCESKA